jgi:hypothetical protein
MKSKPFFNFFKGDFKMDDLHRDAMIFYNIYLKKSCFIKRLFIQLIVMYNPFFFVDALIKTGEYKICRKCSGYFRKGIRKQKTGKYICEDCDTIKKRK